MRSTVPGRMASLDDDSRGALVARARWLAAAEGRGALRAVSSYGAFHWPVMRARWYQRANSTSSQASLQNPFLLHRATATIYW